MQVEAVVFTRPSEVAMGSVEMPPPGPGEVQVKTLCSTISCGTEGWALRNLFTWDRTPYPCVPGYQRVGIIMALGEGVSGWQIGQKVATTTGVWDGPVKPFWGAHIAMANVKASELYELPAGVDDVDAASLVVAQVGYNAASRMVLTAGQWVVVYGDGLIGQCAAQAARARGARVVLVGHRPVRVKLAAEHSADVAIDSRETDVAQAVAKETGADGVAAVIDTVQTEEAQVEYCRFLPARLGQVVYSGFTPGKTWADMALLQQRELTAHFVSGWTRPRMEATLKLMAEGRVRVRPLVTHLVPYRRGPELYRMILRKDPSFLGLTLDWTGACS